MLFITDDPWVSDFSLCDLKESFITKPAAVFENLDSRLNRRGMHVEAKYDNALDL